VVVTNQTAVARGHLSEAEVERRHEELQRRLGGVVDRFLFCPHHPEATVEAYRVVCDCRKPRDGMLRRAAEALDVDLARSVLVGTLGWLSREGFTDVVINLHHLADLVPATVGDGRDHGVSITYVREERLLGTAGSVRAMAPELGTGDVLVVYGDLLIDQPLDA